MAAETHSSTAETHSSNLPRRLNKNSRRVKRTLLCRLNSHKLAAGYKTTVSSKGFETEHDVDFISTV